MKIVIVLIFLVSTVCFAEIYGKIKSVVKSDGNLRIKVSFYDSKIGENKVVKDKLVDLAVETDSYYISDNDVAESILNGFVKKRIVALKTPVVPEVKPIPEKVNANILKGKKIRRIYNF